MRLFWNRVEEGLIVLQATLNSWSVRRWLLAGALFCGVNALGVMARYEFNPTALIRFGEYYVEQNAAYTPRGAVRLTGSEAYGGNGYDGQIFYYYARTLLMPDVWPQGFSRAYRAPRVGYPLIVAPFALFGHIHPELGHWATAIGLIGVQLVLSGVALLCLLSMLPAERRYLAIFLVISPFALLSFLLTVSDSIMLAFVLIGFAYFQRAFGWPLDRDLPKFEWRPALVAYGAFSLAILSKESALFFLFPLGLATLFAWRLPAAVFVGAVLLPAAVWQVYLRTVHGMVPAGHLAIFLEPFDGMRGAVGEIGGLIVEFLRAPSGGALIALVKGSAKGLLLLYFGAALYATFSGAVRKFLPLRLALCFALASVIIADYYYFWSVFDNVARMFTISAALLILLRGEDETAKTWPAFAMLTLLSAFVTLRTLALTPSFPHDVYAPYAGPSYADHARQVGE